MDKQAFDEMNRAVIDEFRANVLAPVHFIRAVAPRRAYALHDGLLNDNGVGLYGGMLERLSGTTYARLAPGTTID